jgi:hypothetical protein
MTRGDRIAANISRAIGRNRKTFGETRMSELDNSTPKELNQTGAEGGKESTRVPARTNMGSPTADSITSGMTCDSPVPVTIPPVASTSDPYSKNVSANFSTDVFKNQAGPRGATDDQLEGVGG